MPDVSIMDFLIIIIIAVNNMELLKIVDILTLNRSHYPYIIGPHYPYIIFACKTLMTITKK